MCRLSSIEINLSAYKIVLQFQAPSPHLVLHFDTPSRKFYFALIALIVHEMKQKDHPGYVYIRKHEKQLRFLDDALAGSYASKTADGMWEKIRKAWHYSLPNLEEGAHFKIEGRDLISPYEKGGKFLYECTGYECDTWANFFGIDATTNKWRFKFAFDAPKLDLKNITLILDNKKDRTAWETFFENLERNAAINLPENHVESSEYDTRVYRNRWAFFAGAVLTIVLFLLGGAALLNHFRVEPQAQNESITQEKTSVAVLPFINISDDPEQEYFCDGITEELINNLGRLTDLRVISRTSAFYFKDKGFDLRTIGEKLNVDNILEGSVRVSDNQLRISTQLIDVKNDSHLWAETYDRQMKDIFNLQDNIAQEIVCNLKTRLGCKPGDYVKNYTDNTKAYNLYLKGRFFSTPMSYAKAIDYFQKAIALDPTFALAYVGEADVYNEMAFHFPKSLNELYPKAKAAAEKAIEIDKNLGEAHAALGFIKLRYEWDWKDAESYLERAIELNPSHSLSHRKLSSYLRAVGRVDESLLKIKDALMLDPLSHIANAQLGLTLQCQGKLKLAAKQLQKTREIYPNNPIVLAWLGSALVEDGRMDQGIAELKKAAEITGRKAPFVLGTLGYALGVSGRASEAKEILTEVTQKRSNDNFPPTFIAMIYLGLNNKDRAFEWLERAIEQKDPLAYPIKTMPSFKSLYSDPRWSELMIKMGLTA